MSGWWGLVYFVGLVAGLGVVGMLGAAGIQAALGALLPRGSARNVTPHPVSGDAAGLLQKVEGHALPTLCLISTDQSVFSKLGGAPDLDDRQAWPTSIVTHRFPKREVTTSMGFVAQLDLSEVRGRSGLASATGAPLLLRRALDGGGSACRGIW